MVDHDGSSDPRSATGSARYRTGWHIAIALTAAAAFGAADQYLGAGHSAVLTAISGMSAPWLVLPFLVGACQPTRGRSAVVGLAATWVAVGAYVLMIISPMEGTHLGPRPAGLTVGTWNQLSLHEFLVVAASQWLWFAGGLIAGPLYGLLGYHWRVRRSWFAALAASLALALEPAAEWLAGHSGFVIRSWPSGAWPAAYAELIAGMGLTIAVAMAPRWRRVWDSNPR